MRVHGLNLLGGGYSYIVTIRQLIYLHTYTGKASKMANCLIAFNYAFVTHDINIYMLYFQYLGYHLFFFFSF